MNPVHASRWISVTLHALIAATSALAADPTPLEAEQSVRQLIARTSEAVDELEGDLPPGSGLDHRTYGSLVLVTLGASRASTVFDGETERVARLLLADSLGKIRPILLDSDTPLFESLSGDRQSYLAGYTMHLLAELIESGHAPRAQCERALEDLVVTVVGKKMVQGEWTYTLEEGSRPDSSISAAVATGLAMALPHVAPGLGTRIDEKLAAYTDGVMAANYLSAGRYSDRDRHPSKTLGAVAALDQIIRVGGAARVPESLRGKVGEFVFGDRCLETSVGGSATNWPHYRAYYFSLISDVGVYDESGPMTSLLQGGRAWSLAAGESHGAGAGNLYEAGYRLFAIANAAHRVWLTHHPTGGVGVMRGSHASPDLWCAPAGGVAPPRNPSDLAPARYIEPPMSNAPGAFVVPAESLRGEWPDQVDAVWIWAERTGNGEETVCSNVLRVDLP